MLLGPSQTSAWNFLLAHTIVCTEGPSEELCISLRGAVTNAMLLDTL